MLSILMGVRREELSSLAVLLRIHIYLHLASLLLLLFLLLSMSFLISSQFVAFFPQYCRSYFFSRNRVTVIGLFLLLLLLSLPSGFLCVIYLCPFWSYFPFYCKSHFQGCRFLSQAFCQCLCLYSMYEFWSHCLFQYLYLFFGISFFPKNVCLILLNSVPPRVSFSFISSSVVRSSATIAARYLNL